MYTVQVVDQLVCYKTWRIVDKTCNKHERLCLTHYKPRKLKIRLEVECFSLTSRSERARCSLCVQLQFKKANFDALRKAISVTPLDMHGVWWKWCGSMWGKLAWFILECRWVVYTKDQTWGWKTSKMDWSRNYQTIEEEKTAIQTKQRIVQRTITGQKVKK